VIGLGAGMAITVAPLTTVVMNSAGQERVGAASGINNAIARVAGVLAVAVLGIVMLNAFGSRLNRSLVHLPLPPGVLETVQSEKIKLAGLQVPAALSLATKAAITESVAEAFVFGFRIVILICTGLSLASSTVAWLLIPRSNIDSSSAR
jgi:hypothetical protein